MFLWVSKSWNGYNKRKGKTEWLRQATLYQIDQGLLPINQGEGVKGSERIPLSPMCSMNYSIPCSLTSTRQVTFSADPIESPAQSLSERRNNFHETGFNLTFI